MKMFFLRILPVTFLSIFPVSGHAENAETDMVFFTAFKAAIVTSLCTDAIEASSNSNEKQPKELENLMQICKKKGAQNKAVLDAYTGAKSL